MSADHLKLLQNAIRWTLNEEPVVEIDGPGVIDVTVWRQKDSITVHLVNLTNPMMMKGPFREFIPVNLSVRIKIPKGTKTRDVKLLIKNSLPEFKNKNGYIILDVSQIMDHEIIGIDLIPD
jgi:hypothetical protein